MQSEAVLQDHAAHELEVAVRLLAAHRSKVTTMIGAMETVLVLFERPHAFELLYDTKSAPGGFYRDVGNRAAHPTYDRQLMQDALDRGMLNFDFVGKGGLLQLFEAMNAMKPERDKHAVPDGLQGSDMLAGFVGFRSCFAT